ncbi:MAG: ATP-binding protein, partial [Bacteroidales bacterium]|nr:ATP-binding protein [Bacteroidales bacterium]
SLLISALDEGIIYAQGNRLEMVVNGNETSTNVSYKFQHYRIQQIIQGMLSEESRNEVHFRIGQHYLNFLPDNIRNEQLIEITHHLNFGLHLIPSTEGKIRFAEYNLQAANKAMASAAYSSAIVFFEKGMQLLPIDSKDANYDLWISLNKGFAECAYQVGRYDNAEEAIDKLLRNIQDKLDKASVIAMRLRQYATMGKPHEAIAEGVKALSILGVKLSVNPGMSTILRELITARLRQGNRKTESLIDLPVMNNPKMKMIARLLTEMGAPAYTLGNDNLYGLLALKVVNLSLKYGYTHELPYALVAYGMLKTIAFGNMKEGSNLGNLAIALNDKYNDLEYRCRVIAAYGVLIHHWNHHWSSLTSWFKKGIEAGIHSGDIFYLSHSASNCVVWDPKLNLINKIEEHKKFVDIIRETGFTDAIDTSEMRLQLLRNLREETINRFSLTSHEFFEEKRLNEMSSRKYISGIAIYHITKSEIYLLYNDPEKSYRHIEKADDIIKALIGLNYTLLLSVTAFHAASQLLSKNNLSKEDHAKYWRRMESEFKQMKKWSRHNPENYHHHLLIMEAEILKHRGKYNKATSLYKKAIENAGKNLWLKDEAFFNEVTAKFFIEQNLISASTGYIKQAFYLYKRLGTNAKVSQLLEEYPELEEFLNAKTNFSDFDSISIKQSSHSTTNGSIGILDMNTITKASQTISSEIILDTLLKKLMQITIENVGAQRGVLLLNENDNLRVQAENNVDDNTIKVLQSVPLQEYARIPHTLINYVINSRKNVVLSHAYFEGNFTQDPYIIKHQPKSVLAEPIIKQNQLYGIIYFENNLNTGVFSEERQMMLSILVTQIAISIENSIMYENLEEKIKERTVELTEANRQLTKKNEQIEKQKVELEKLNASKDKMFSIIAHDLRSPFNSILIGTQLLSRNVLDYSKKEIEDFVKGIHQSSQKVFNLLENLLNWAMSQTGRTVFEPQNIELIDIVNEVIEIAEESSIQKNIRIESMVEEDVMVYADQHMLYTVLRNLTNNAIKYCHWGGLIQISAQNSSQITQITVKDDGVGIPEEKIGKLFEISEKVSTPGTNDEKGTGLGLILCKEFIEKHHGEIWVESKPSEGCTFHFTIPDKR